MSVLPPCTVGQEVFPTAHTSVALTWATPFSTLFTPDRLGLGTTVHADPFHLSIRGV